MTRFTIEFSTRSNEPVWVDPIGWDWTGLPRARRIDNGKPFSILKSTNIDDPYYWDGPYLKIKTPYGEQLLEIRPTSSGSKPNFYFDGIYIYCGERPAPLKPGFVISYDKAKKLIRVYAPNEHEANYAKKDYGKDTSLLEQAVKGQLVTNLAPHTNMYYAAHFLAKLAAGNRQKENDVHAALTYLNAGKSPVDSVRRGLGIIKATAKAHVDVIKPLIRNLRGLSSRAQKMLDGVATSSFEARAETPLIKLPSTQPMLFTGVLMLKPREAVSTLNIVAFFYDMVWDRGIHKQNKKFHQEALKVFRKFKPIARLPSKDSLKTAEDPELRVSSPSMKTYQRIDGGVFYGINLLSAAGGIWGQFRAFISWDPENPNFGKIHLRLLNYAGVATPNGVADSGVFSLWDMNMRFNWTTGKTEDWKHTIGVYALAEVAFPLSGQGSEPVVGRELQDLIAERGLLGGVASKVGGSIANAFKWLRINLSSGITQTYKQIRNVASSLTEDARELSNTFGPLDGQLGVYVGLSVTSNFSAKPALQRFLQLLSETVGAGAGGGAGFAMGYMAGLVASPQTQAAVTDLGLELGAFGGALVYSQLAKDDAELSFDVGALAAAFLRQPIGPTSGGVFVQYNIFGSAPIHTFS